MNYLVYKFEAYIAVIKKLCIFIQMSNMKD